MKKFIFGVLISSLFVYLTFRGVEFETICQGLKDVRYRFLIPGLGFPLLISFLRSLRWGIILSPLEKIGQKKLIPLTCIGYMAVIVIPMRIGEFLRPYLLSTSSKISISSAVGTIIVERTLDILTILAILFIVVFISSSPEWLLKTGYSLLPFFLLLIFFLCFFYFKKELSLKILKPVLDRLPTEVGKKVEGLLQNLTDGFSIISNPVRLVYALLLSIFIWISSALTAYSIFYFLDLQLPLVSAFMVLIITIVGISIPAAPGMVGNFQYAAIVALSLFNVEKTDAFIFSMVYYFLGVGVAILLGLVFLPLVDISIKDIRNKLKI